MSLSKQAVAELAQSIRECRVMAVAHAEGRASGVYPCMVGGLESTIAHFIQQQGRDSTEVKAAFAHEPTADELNAYQERQARWKADYAARKAATGSAA